MGIFDFWQDGVDPTKKVNFNATAVSTATTRVISMPDRSGTLFEASSIFIDGDPIAGLAATEVRAALAELQGDITGLVTNYVPYTGATGDVTLGIHNLYARQLYVEEDYGLAYRESGFNVWRNFTSAETLTFLDVVNNRNQLELVGGIDASTAFASINSKLYVEGKVGIGTGASIYSHKLVVISDGANAIASFHRGGSLHSLIFSDGSIGDELGLIDNRDQIIAASDNASASKFSYADYAISVDNNVTTFAGNIVAPTIKLTTGAAANYVLISDADGDASWVASSSLPAFANYVPYTGATGTVNLGSQQLSAGVISADRLSLTYNGGDGGVRFKNGFGTENWNIRGYGVNLAVRDMSNARDQVLFTSGATATIASTTIDSRLNVTDSVTALSLAITNGTDKPLRSYRDADYSGWYNGAALGDAERVIIGNGLAYMAVTGGGYMSLLTGGFSTRTTNGITAYAVNGIDYAPVAGSTLNAFSTLAINGADDGLAKWQLYRSNGDATLYIRDMANARQQAYFYPGANAYTAATTIDSLLTIKGRKLSIWTDVDGTLLSPGTATLDLLSTGANYPVGRIQGRVYANDAAYTDLVLSANPNILAAIATDDLVIRGSTGNVEVKRGYLVVNDGDSGRVVMGPDSFVEAGATELRILQPTGNSYFDYGTNMIFRRSSDYATALTLNSSNNAIFEGTVTAATSLNIKEAGGTNRWSFIKLADPGTTLHVYDFVNLRTQMAFEPGTTQTTSNTAVYSNFSVAGALTAPTIKLTTGAAANYVLTSDADGDATWTNSSSLPALANYVPYTGATGAVDLGTQQLTAGIATFGSGVNLPVTINGDIGATIYKGTTGGYLIGNKFTGSAGTSFGYIGAVGTTDTFEQFVIGPVGDYFLTIGTDGSAVLKGDMTFKGRSGGYLTGSKFVGSAGTMHGWIGSIGTNDAHESFVIGPVGDYYLQLATPSGNATFKGNASFASTKGINWTGQDSSVTATDGEVLVSGYNGVDIYSAVSTADFRFINNETGTLLTIDGTQGNATFIGDVAATALILPEGNGVRFKNNTNTVAWMSYNSGLAHYLRDMVNSRMQVSYSPGASATDAVTQFGSTVIVDGNVGVGVTPTYKFVVSDSAVDGIAGRFIQNSTSGSPYGVYAEAVGAATQNVAGYFSATGATYNFGVFINAPNVGANNYALYSPATAKSHFAGNVGIGTTTPTYQLDLLGAEGFSQRNSIGVARSVIKDGRFYPNIDGSTSYYLSSDTLSIGWAGSGVITTVAGKLTIDPEGTSDVIMQPSGGNVGIGTTAPLTALEVVGGYLPGATIRATGTGAGYTQGAFLSSSGIDSTPESRGQGMYLFNEGTDTTWYIGTNYTNADLFSINRKGSTTSFDPAAAQIGHAYLTIDNAGNTTVAGNITAPTIKLTSGAAAGYLLTSDADGDASWTNPSTLPILGSYVPYSGATGTVNLGSQALLAGSATIAGNFDVQTSINSALRSMVRNDSSGASSYAQFIACAYGNSWGLGVGSTANNSNTFEIREDALSANTLRLKIDVGGKVTIPGMVGIAGAVADTDRELGVLGTIRSNYLHVTAADDNWNSGRGIRLSPNLWNATSTLLGYNNGTGAFVVGADGTNLGGVTAFRYSAHDSGGSIVGVIDDVDKFTFNSTGLTVTDKLTTSAFKLTTGAAANYVLTSDADGDAAWVASSSLPALADYVPYTGATTNVNLGVRTLSTSKLLAGTSPGSTYTIESDGYMRASEVGATAVGFLSSNSAAMWAAQVNTSGNFEIARYSPSYIQALTVSDSFINAYEPVLIQGDVAGTFTGLTVRNLTTNQSGVKTHISLPVFNGNGGGIIEEIGNSVDGYRLNIYQQQASGSLSLGTAGDNPRLFISYEGNVGIGNGLSNPGATLHVVDGGTNAQTTLSLNSRITVTGDGVFKWGSSANIGTLTWDTGKAFVLGQSGNNLHLGGSGAVNQMILNGSVATIAGEGVGKAYIGTAAFSSGDYTGISLGNSLSTTDYNLLSGPHDPDLYINRPTGYDIHFRENNGNDQLAIITGGRVGIGTASPAVKLEISDATNGSVYPLRITSTDAAWAPDQELGIQFAQLSTEIGRIAFTYFSSGGDCGYKFYGYDAGLNSTPIVSMRGNGKVGIGTVNPAQNLHLLTGGNTAQKIEHDNIGFIQFEKTTGGDSWTITHNYYSNDLTFSTGGPGSGNQVTFKDSAVGIGTTAPGEKLEVAGSIKTTDGALANYVKGFHGYIGRTSDGVVHLAGTTGFAGETYINYNGGQVYVGKATPGIFEVNNGVLHVTVAGNVGIGTTVPATILDVNTLGSNYGARFGRLGGTGIELSHYGTTAGRIISYNRTAETYSDLFFGTTASENTLYLKNDGNVGIGAVPTYDLDLSKTKIGSNVVSSIANLDNTNAASNAVIGAIVGGSSGGDPFARFTIGGVLDWAVGIDNSDSDKFKISKSTTLGTNDYLAIDTSGNVGIGTGGPLYRFHVYDGGNTSAMFETTATNECQVLLKSPSRQFSMAVAGASSSIGLAAGSFAIRDYSAGYNRLVVDTSGNVGIGTDSPDANLDVNNGTANTVDRAIAIRGLLGAVNAGHSIDWFAGAGNVGAATNAFARIAGVTDAGGMGGELAFYTNSGLGAIASTEKVRITGAGNVGIGTTAPESLLHIHSAVGNSSLQLTSAGTVDLRLLNAQTEGYLQMYSNHDLHIRTNNTNRMVVKAGGNVGIGTNSPDSYLSGFAGLAVYNSTTPATSIADSTDFWVTYLSTGDWRLWNNLGTDRLTVKSNGNVGIGTTSPGTKLEVAGNITAQTIKLTTGAAANYVLTSDADGDASWTASSSLPALANYVPYTGATQSVNLGGYQLIAASARVSDGGGVNHNNGAGNIAWLEYTTGGPFYLRDVINSRMQVGYAAGADSANSSTYFYSRAIIDSTSQYALGVQNPTTTAAASAFFTNTTNQLYIGVESSAGGAVGSTVPYSGFVSSQGNYPLVLMTNALPRVTIGDSGNVGVGTTSPASKLDVRKTASDTVSVANSSFYFNDNVLSAGLLGQQKLTSPYAFVLQAQNEANSSYFPIAINPLGGNVGIGTTSPDVSLDVAGGALFRVAADIESWRGIEITPAVYNGNQYIRARGGGGTFNIVSGCTATGNDDSYIKFSPNSGHIDFGTNTAGAAATQRMRISGDGNVGIGTTSPQFPLSIGNAALGNKIALYDDGGTTQYGFGVQSGLLEIFIDAADGDVAIGYGSSGSLVRTATFKGSGNVGIGTSSPGAKLHVPGSIKLGSDTDSSSDMQIGPMTNNYPYLRFDSYQSDNSGYFWGFGQRTSLGATRVNAFFVDNSRGLRSVDRLEVVTFTSNEYNSGYPTYSIPVRISSSGDTYFNGGNVGIGTASPLDKLQISDDSGNLSFGSPLTSYLGLAFGGVAVTSTNYSLMGDGGHTLINRSAGYDICFREANSNQVVIKATTGNVGIGTASPGYKLTSVDSQADGIAGYFAQTSTSGTPFGIYSTITGAATQNIAGYFNATGATYNYGVMINAPNVGANNWALYSPATAQSYFAGNVGIGTSTPTTNLHVSAASGGIIRLTDTTSPLNLDMQVGDSLAYFGTQSNHELRLMTNNTERMTLQAGGNIGIGTTSPVTKLDVVGGDAQVDGFGRFKGWNSQATGTGLAAEIGISGGAGYVIAYNRTVPGYADLILQGDAMAIKSDGKIGIGTTSPVGVFDVRGAYTPPGIYGFNYLTTTSMRLVSTNTAGAGVGPVLAFGAESNLGTTPYGFAYIQGAQQTANQYGGILSFWTSSSGDNGETDSAVYQRMVITKTGAVGIGTASPAAKLDVVGTAAFTGSVTGSTFKFANGSYLSSDATYNYSIDELDATKAFRAAKFVADQNATMLQSASGDKITSNALGDPWYLLKSDNSALGLKVGSLVISNSYSDAAPTNGLFVKNGIKIGSTDGVSFEYGAGYPWQLCGASTANMYLLDHVNARTHLAFVPGAGNNVASTTLNSTLQIGAATAGVLSTGSYSALKIAGASSTYIESYTGQLLAGEDAGAFYYGYGFNSPTKPIYLGHAAVSTLFLAGNITRVQAEGTLYLESDGAVVVRDKSSTSQLFVVDNNGATQYRTGVWNSTYDDSANRFRFVSSGATELAGSVQIGTATNGVLSTGSVLSALKVAGGAASFIEGYTGQCLVGEDASGFYFGTGFIASTKASYFGAETSANTYLSGVNAFVRAHTGNTYIDADGSIQMRDTSSGAVNWFLANDGRTYVKPDVWHYSYGDIHRWLYTTGGATSFNDSVNLVGSSRANGFYSDGTICWGSNGASGNERGRLTWDTNKGIIYSPVELELQSSTVDIYSGNLVVSGSRPVTTNGALGTVTFKPDTGGWIIGNKFTGSADTVHGYIGTIGTSDALTAFVIGPIGDYYLQLAASTGVATFKSSLIIPEGSGTYFKDNLGGLAWLSYNSGTTHYLRDTTNSRMQVSYYAGTTAANATTQVHSKLTVDELLTAPSIKITTGAGAGKILTSDADGDATWEAASALGVPYTGATDHVNLGEYGLKTKVGVTLLKVIDGSALFKFGLSGTTNSSIYDEVNERDQVVFDAGVDSDTAVTTFKSDVVVEGTDTTVVNLTAAAVKITTGASAGYLLTSDADGDATWVAPPLAAAPYGSVNYFDLSGTLITIATQSTTGTDNNEDVDPNTTLSANGLDFDTGDPAEEGLLRYTGAVTRMFVVRATISFSGTAGDKITFFFKRNGGTVVTDATIAVQEIPSSGEIISVMIHGFISLAEDDYIRTAVANVTGTADITVYSLNISAMAFSPD